MESFNEPLLDNLLGQLESARAWSPRVISKLESFIRTADDYTLFRVNPYLYATEKGMAESEAIDLFIHSAKIGLFEMEWHLVCAACGHVVESLRSMNHLHSHFQCNLCAYENTATMDDYIQVTFTLSTQIRDNVFRHPETLSAEDFCLKYSLCKGIWSPPGAPSFEAFLRDASKLMAFLEPGETRTTEFETRPGIVALVDILNNSTVHFIVSFDGIVNPQLQVVQAQSINGKLRVNNRTLQPNEFVIGPGTFGFTQYAELQSGQVRFEIENPSQQRGLIWLMHIEGEPPTTGLTFHPFLSGKRLLNAQTFRTLYRTETVSADEGIGVKDITILFTDLKGSTALYDQIGDPKAYFLVRQHFDTLGNVVNRYEGATVKTIGDAVMATFMTPLDSVRAALDMLRDIETFNRNISDKLVLKIGIHVGHSIVVTLNDRLDYFGQTVNIASRVQGLADADEIYISEAIYAYPGVRAALASCVITPEQVAVKGVSETLQVYKVKMQ